MPTMQARLAAAGAALGLLALLAIWWAGSLGAPPPVAAPAGSALPPAAAVAADAREVATRRLAIDAGVADAPAPAPAAAALTGHLRVLVRTEAGEPLPGCRVLAAGQEKSTDAAGAAAFEVEAARTSVAVAPPAGRALIECSGWQNVRAGVATELVVVLAAPPATIFWCRLVAAEDERPLAAVELRALPAETGVRTDAEGFAQIAVLDDQTYLDAFAAGRGPRRIVPTADHATREAALRVPLALAGTLSVRTVDAAQSPVAGVQLVLRAQPWLITLPREVALRGGAFTWQATSDAAGLMQLTDLPVGVPLEATLTAPDAFAAMPEQRWVLAGGREQRTVELAAAAVVLGRVADAAGSPVADVPVQAAAPDRELLPRVLGGAPAMRRTRTAADGTFRLGGLAPGPWWVGIPYDGVHQPTSAAVHVPPGGRVELALRALPGLIVAGVARDADGAPCRGITVDLRIDDAPTSEASTDAAGRFRFVGLPAGPCALRTRLFETDFGLAAPVTVAAGDEEVVLELRSLHGSLSGSWVDGRDAWIMAYRRGSDDAIGTRCDLDGTFFYRGLRPGLWDLIGFDRRGRAGWLAGAEVRAGRETDGLALVPQPAGMLLPRHASADEFLVARGEQIAGRDSLEPGVAGEARVPAGEWTVVFRSRGREVARRQVQVVAGRTLVVDGGS
jgi:hypothetical protein